MERRARELYGENAEITLKSRLEKILGENLVKTPSKFDKFDWESESFFVELKSRRKPYTPASFATWYLPICKGIRASQETKKVVFFYYFDSVDELYRLDYCEELFDSFVREIPYGHRDKQIHFCIPSYRFKKIESEQTLVQE